MKKRLYNGFIALAIYNVGYIFMGFFTKGFVNWEALLFADICGPTIVGLLYYLYNKFKNRKRV